MTEEEMLKQAEDLAERTAESATELATAFNTMSRKAFETPKSPFPFLPPDPAERILRELLLPKIRQLLDEILKAVQAAIDLVRYALEHHTPFVSLIVQCFNWLDNVQKPLNEIASTVPIGTGSKNPQGESEWTGNAKEAYVKRNGQQKAAMIAVAGKAEMISHWLEQVLLSNLKFWEWIAGVVSDLVATLAAAVIEAGSIVGILKAIEDVGTSVKECIKLKGDAYIKLGSDFVAAMDGFQDVKKLTGQIAEFPPNSSGKSPAWPEAVVG